MGSAADANGASDRLASLIDRIVDRCPDAAVLIALIIHNGDAATNERTRDYNEDVASIVRSRAGDNKKVYLVNQYDSVTTSDIDGLHPYQAGYEIMGQTWTQAIQQVNSFGWIKDLFQALMAQLPRLHAVEIYSGTRTANCSMVQGLVRTTTLAWSVKTSKSFVNHSRLAHQSAN